MWTSCVKNYTVLIADLDKINLVKIRNGGLVMGSSQFPLLPYKMTLTSKVVKYRPKNNHLASLV